MPTRDLRDDRIGSERLFDRPRLLLIGPTPPPARSRDHLNATRRRRLRVKRKIKSRHKPISKSGNQTCRSRLQTEGVSGTPLTVDDALHVAPLLDQLAEAPASFMGDGAYDRAWLLEGVLARNPNANSSCLHAKEP